MNSKMEDKVEVETKTPSESQLFLRWNNYRMNLTRACNLFWQNQLFVDVTLICDGHSMKAHKIVLSACSSYFNALLIDNPCDHPIIEMQDFKWDELQAVVNFLYQGEITVSQNQIAQLIRIAETLKVRGLANINVGNYHRGNSQSSALQRRSEGTNDKTAFIPSNEGVFSLLPMEPKQSKTRKISANGVGTSTIALDNHPQQHQNHLIMPIHLHESEPDTLKTCWDDINDDEYIYNKFRGSLNKLTQKNLYNILESACNIRINTVESVCKVAKLIFDRIISEPKYATTYYKFCMLLFNPTSPNHVAFMATFIRCILDEFDCNINNAKSKTIKLKPLMDKLANAKNAKDTQEIKREIDYKEYQFRRRGFETLRLIVKMWKMSFIETDCVCAHIESLLDVTCEDKLEFMCKLLIMAGPQLENQQPYEKIWNIKERLDAIFTKIRQLILANNQDTGPKISNRIRFMMLNILAFRATLCHQREIVKAPIPLQEISPAMRWQKPSRREQKEHRSCTPFISWRSGQKK